ncbi:MAG: ATPase [Candidatus Pelagibacterales bacterium]|nr:ATPase [Candidatus Pelagibacter sp.]RZO61719.1 MAG: ATPase [Pelagibacterales bacterium]|tara:strand:+ start:1594 stop:2094 length:501 start_codon:yes stop_codon:yes gene_type:complete
MVIDATFWVAVSFIIFILGLIYLKVPQKINLLLDNSINVIKNEIEEAEKIKNETKKLLNDSQIKIDNAQKESQKIIETAKAESEKMIIEVNEKFFLASENRKKLADQKIEQIKNIAIKEIKNTSIKIAIESTEKIIQTSIDKSKLDTIYQENLEDIKKSLKKSTTI